MSERWIQSLEKMLDQMKKLEEAEAKDRLDHVRLIRFTLGALHRSLLGRMQWANNPNLMTKFTKEELEEIDQKILEFTRSFIEYDIEVAKKGGEKGLKAKRRVRRSRGEGTEVFYI